MLVRLAIAVLVASSISIYGTASSSIIFARGASHHDSAEAGALPPEQLPALPCALGHDEAGLVEAMSPAASFERDRTFGHDANYRVRENTETIAAFMEDLAHPGTGAISRHFGVPTKGPDAASIARDADPVAHAQGRCFMAYYVRELRTEIAILELPDSAVAQRHKLNNEITDDNHRVGLVAETPAFRRKMARVDAAGARLAAAGELRHAAPPDCAKCISDYQLAIARYSAELRDAQREYCQSGEAPKDTCQ